MWIKWKLNTLSASFLHLLNIPVIELSRDTSVLTNRECLVFETLATRLRTKFTDIFYIGEKNCSAAFHASCSIHLLLRHLVLLRAWACGNLSRECQNRRGYSNKSLKLASHCLRRSTTFCLCWKCSAFRVLSIQHGDVKKLPCAKPHLF